MVTAEARDGVDTKMLEVGLRNGAAAREPAVPNSRDSRWFQWLKKRRNPDVEFLGEINVIPTLRTSWEDSQLGKIMEWIEKEDFP